MTADTSLARTTGTGLAPLGFDDSQREMIRNSLANGASDAEFTVLWEIAKARRLNPLLRQIHFVKRWDSQKRCEVWSVQAAIDGLRAIAQRTGLYDGQDEPEFVENPDGSLRLCKVRVYRKDWDKPSVGVAYWSEYVQTIRDKVTGKERPGPMWLRMPHTMLSKCAESLALRKAFPEDMSGLYTTEEMGQADNALPALETQHRAPAMEAPSAPPALPAPEAPPADTIPDVDPEASRAYADYVTAVEAAKGCEGVAVAYNSLAPALRLEGKKPEEWTKDALALAMRRVADLGVVAGGQAMKLLATDMGDLPGLVDDLLSKHPAVIPAWLVAHRAVIATLPAPGPDVVRMVAARRHAGVVTMDQASTSAATRALDEAVAALTGREPGGDDGDDTTPPTAPTTPAKGSRRATTAKATPVTAAAPEGSVATLAEHLRAKPHVIDPMDTRGRDREHSEVAVSYLKRAPGLAALGRADEALDCVRDELRRRGCLDPDALLVGVARHLGWRRAA